MEDIDKTLKEILERVGSSLSVAQVRESLSSSKSEISEDNKAHGGSGEEPFWDMTSDQQVHVFSIFSSFSLELYVFQADFHTLLNHLSVISMSEVDGLKSLLRETYNVVSPAISVSRSHAEHWLS